LNYTRECLQRYPALLILPSVTPLGQDGVHDRRTIHRPRGG